MNMKKAVKKQLAERQAGEFYDKFFTESGKNMPRKEFIRQLTGLSDPKNMQTDLAQIQARKSQRQSIQANNTRRINHAMRGD